MVLLAHQILTIPSTVEPRPGPAWAATAGSIIPSADHLLPPQRELRFERERKMNEQLQLEKPGASPDSKFKESSCKGALWDPCRVCLGGLRPSNVPGIALTSHIIILGQVLYSITNIAF